MSNKEDQKKDPAYEPPRLERHGTLAEITKRYRGTGSDNEGRDRGEHAIDD